MLIEIHVILFTDQVLREKLGQIMVEIAHLPGEVLEQIFSYFSDLATVKSVSLVSR